MFLNYIKNLSTKKKIKNKLSNGSNIANNNLIKTVGIIFDETYFQDKEALIQELVSRGISEQNIEILIFRDIIKKKQTFDWPFFSNKNLNWNATFNKSEVNNFINTPFDLLINYYDIEKSALILVSHLSKANFKTGFSSIDKRVNDFMIDTTVENYKVFIRELFMYLKILNKI